MNVSPRQNPAYRLSLRFLRALRRSRWGLLLLLYAALITGISHVELSSGSGMLFPGADKIFHGVEFALFGWLAWMTCRRRVLPALLLSAAFAGLDELHQAFVPGRDACLLDALADVGGALLALLIASKGRALWGLLHSRILSRNDSTGGI
jgi:hypothetical protein